MKKNTLLFFWLFMPYFVLGQWQTLNTPMSSIDLEVSVVSNDIIWLMDSVNAYKDFAITTNGGLSWSYNTLPDFGNNVGYGVLCAVSATTAFVPVYSDSADSGIYKTINSGVTWVREVGIFDGLNAFPNQVHFWNENKGFAMGDGLEIYFYDSGNWYPSTMPASPKGSYSYNNSRSLRIVGDNAYFLTGAGTIFKSDDFGVSWTEIDTPYTSRSGLSFDFKDANNGVLIFKDINYNKVYRTINGGANWSLIATDTPNLNTFIKYIPSQSRYFSVDSYYGGLSYSDDDGITWVEDVNFQNIPIGEIENSNSGKVVMGGTGVIYYLDSSLGIEELETNKFSLYLNPASSVLTIKSKNQIPIRNILFYDALGKQVKKVNSDFENIDLKYLSAGLYFLKIKSEFGIVSKKLVINK